MNDTQFDNHLRAAFLAPNSESTLDLKIDRALESHKYRRTLRVRFSYSLVAVAAVVGGIVLFPAVKAQAMMSGMVSALDKKMSLEAITYSIDETGQQTRNGTTIIANGEISIRSGNDKRRQLEIGDKSYGFDETLQSYVERPRRRMGIKLSDMLGSAGTFSIKKQVSVQRVLSNGKEVLRATIKNGDLPERYIIDADPDTQLPLHMTIESEELGKWRPRQSMEFNYRDGLKIDKSDLEKYPIISPKEADTMTEDSLTSTVLAKVALKNSNLLIRAIDVATDGTVFVLYQSGDRRTHSWDGYAVGLNDSLKGEYTRVGDLFSSASDEAPKDGKFQLEVFMPAKREKFQPVKLDLTSILTEDGKLGKLIQSTTVYADGRRETKWQLNFGKLGKTVKVLSKTFDKPTCDTAPSWAGKVSYHWFGNEVFSGISKEGARAKAAMESKDWITAERHLNEQLRWMRESEIQGYSPWDQSGPKKNLEIVKKNLRP